ncbi:MAG: hypothetical protein AMQ22_01422 [Candidatus Methanofastidiosum methylothiophilum]|uniref:DUF4430 domain-containing protein n=1 Tax=Candidatus Methanofastidiosum methylothiophilum TaxID=1705564 RepID=A0A150J0D8_9EURY|nr:MAG: hypothetical protein AMQ22_01422 [Candidatus Methanofastidiosum methylthiophilus]
MKGIKFRNFYILFVFLILLVHMPSPFIAESIGSVESAFSNGTVFVTGKNANSLDLLTRDTVSKSFKEMGVLSTNSLDFEIPPNKQLVVVGGPVINSKTKELNDAFGIMYEETQDRVLITAKDLTLSKPKIGSGEDIGIIYFGKSNNSNVLMLWGASREGTFAAGLILEDPTNLQKYGNSQFLLLKWKDNNGDQFVQKDEITITSEAPAISVSTATTEDRNNVTVNITADFGNSYTKEWKSVKVPKDSTIFDAMKTSGMKFDYNIQSLGVFVTSIEGLAENRSTGRYWQYWINEDYSQLGISNIKVADGMIIEWRYTDSFQN